jgi:nitrite reductase/ring-hydroxylating ferredoxin subunit
MVQTATGADMIQVSTLERLKASGVEVVHPNGRAVAIWWHQGKVYAVDNRCPHLGFPLHKGSVQDGILTCHWHHARFDLCSGCTFDLWADDTPAYDAEVHNGNVYVCSKPRHEQGRAHLHARLEHGMQQNIRLIQAKGLSGLLNSGEATSAILPQVVLFGVTQRDGWGPGLTILTAMANIARDLEPDTVYLALYQGITRTAADCAGQAPRRPRAALDSNSLSFETLSRWLDYWTTVRHRDGAERTLLTTIEGGATPEQLAELLFSAATQRPYAAGGHVLDFVNKAFEALDVIGWEHAPAVLPSLTGQLVAARGGEESNPWRHPIDLIVHLDEIDKQLPDLFESGKGRSWHGEVDLAEAILGDDPLLILKAVCDAIAAGAQAVQLGKAVAYAAALRLARFGTANEFGDWITALHTFTYCHALHEALKRCAAPSVVRGVFHGAISVYLDRFLNVPPAKLPTAGAAMEKLPTDAAALRQAFLDLLDQRQSIDDAALIVARYVALGHPIQPLFDTLAQAVVREDADFHTFQMLEASIAEYGQWAGSDQAGHILVALARFLAAHSPTSRAQLQTAQIAQRLQRGAKLYEDVE